MPPGGASISDLPEDLLIRIISLLSAVDAALTTVLSRQWRHLWSHATALHFHQSDLPDPGETYDRFIDPVAATLLAHRGLALRTFELSWDFVSDEFDSVLLAEVCIRTAITRGATDIHLDFAESEGHDCPFTCPPAVSDDDDDDSMRAYEEASPDVDVHVDESDEDSYGSDDDDDGSYPEDPQQELFSLYMPMLCSGKLQMLRLKSCWMSKIPVSPNLQFLESLELVGVHTQNRGFQRLLNSCPVLTNLLIERCSVSGDLHLNWCPLLRTVAVIRCYNLTGLFVDAPMLEVFKYHGVIPKQAHFLLADSPNLYHADLRFRIGMEDSFDGLTCSDFWKFISSFGTVKFLSLTFATLFKVLTQFEHPVMPPSVAALPGVRQMVVKGRMSSLYAAKSIINLLHSAPQLEALSLIRTSEVVEEDERELALGTLSLVPQPECLAHRLRKITFTNMKDKTSYMKLVDYLLKQAMVLEEVCISGVDQSSLQFSRMVNKVNFWSSSPRIRVTAVKSQ